MSYTFVSNFNKIFYEVSKKCIRKFYKRQKIKYWQNWLLFYIYILYYNIYTFIYILGPCKTFALTSYICSYFITIKKLYFFYAFNV